MWDAKSTEKFCWATNKEIQFYLGPHRVPGDYCCRRRHSFIRIWCKSCQRVGPCSACVVDNRMRMTRCYSTSNYQLLSTRTKCCCHRRNEWIRSLTGGNVAVRSVWSYELHHGVATVTQIPHPHTITGSDRCVSVITASWVLSKGNLIVELRGSRVHRTLCKQWGNSVSVVLRAPRSGWTNNTCLSLILLWYEMYLPIPWTEKSNTRGQF